MSSDELESGLPDALPREDVEAIVQILGRVAGMTEPIAERRRELIQSLADLIGADIWVWIHSRVDPATNFPSAFRILDSGWRDDAERAAFVTALHNPQLNAAVIKAQLSLPHTTMLRPEFLDDADPAQQAVLEQWTRTCGLREAVIVAYRLGEHHFSGMGFHRRAGKPPFTFRQRCMVHLITSQIDWLHRAETDVPANNDRLLDLSARQREIVVHLLGGDSRKQIAYKLNLSEHTVADHMKVIYRKFDVSSRGELLSLFMSGGKNKPPANDAAAG